MSAPLKTQWYTDRGRRPSNEDAVLVEALFGDRDLVAVADGMGGHAGGEIASQKALETLLERLSSSNDLSEAIKAANEVLLRESEANPEWRGMGTTLVALLRVGDEYHVANVGDSRAYRFDPSGPQRITQDHSFTAEAISSGRLSEDEAERSPWRNALTRAVGTDTSVDVDVFGPFPVEPPHTVLLCSDGLYRVMSDQELAEELHALEGRADGARDLVANALRRGSSDNISIAIVQFGDVSILGAGAEERSASGVPATRSDPPAQAASGASEPSPASVDSKSSSEPVSSGDPPPTSEETEPDSTTTQPITVRPQPEQASPQEDHGDGPVPPSEEEPRSHGDHGPDEDARRGAPSVEPPDLGASPPATEDYRVKPPSTADVVPPDLRPAARMGTSASSSASGPAQSATTVDTPHRTARPARPKVPARKGPRPRRQVPNWVKREGLPTLLLIGATLVVVYLITQVLS